MRIALPVRFSAATAVIASTAAAFHHPLLFSHPSSSATSLSMSDGGGGPNSMAGKIAYQRFLYTLSPLSDCPETPYSVEERHRFRVADDGRSLEPLGGTTYMLRGGPPSDADSRSAEPPDERKPDGGKRAYTRVGPALYKMRIKEGDEGDEDEVSEGACIAMALFLAAQPELVRGTALQLAAGSGLGGILGCVAAGLGIARGETTSESEEDAEGGGDDDDDILPNNKAAASALLPPDLEKLLLTDASESALNLALHNCKSSGLPASKVDLLPLDFRSRLPKAANNVADLILGADVAFQFPDVKHIARTVAYALKPSQFLGQVGELAGGRFVHVGPHNRDAISELRRKLRRGYRMETDVVYLDLVRRDLAPMVLDSLSDEEGAEIDLLSPPREEDGLGRNGFVEYQNEISSKFTGFIGQHHMDYEGYNGEFFFPAETGAEEDGAPSRWMGGGNVERDEKFRKTDEGRGSWYFEE